jgi:hypothetical protein
MHPRLISIALTLLALLPAAAGAAGVTFSDRAAFQAAIGPHKIYTFDPADGFPLAPAPIQFLGGPFPQVSSNGGPASLDTYGPSPNQALTGRSNNQVDRAAILTIFPAPAQHAIGFDILDLGSPGAESATIVINDGSDRLVVPYHIADNDGNPATPVFFGVIWDMDITGLDVYAENLLCAGPGTCFTPNLIDNLTLAPEPTSLFLLLAAPLPIMRRPRRSATAPG